MQKFILTILIFFWANTHAELWKSLDVISNNDNKLIQHPDSFEINATNYHLVKFDIDSFQYQIGVNSDNNVQNINLPLPSGGFETFEIFAVTIMDEKLATKFPDIHTFRGYSINDSTRTLVLDVTKKGLHAVIRTGTQVIWINPINRINSEKHISYYQSDYHKNTDNWQCLAADLQLNSNIAIHSPRVKGALPINELNLKTYRLAVAATAEYTIYHSSPDPANVADAMAAIVTAMNRVNGIYETELGIRMILVANNDQVIFTDPATDGYTNSDGFNMLDENQMIVDNTIGSANYDIGHVFSTGGGGIAGFGVVCNDFRKAEGATGLPNPINDFFYVDYVTHEIAHQLRALHTFNTNVNFCDSSRTGSAAVEPGGGSTLLGYAGICAPDNLQNFSDAYFNSHSLQEITSFTTSGIGANCSNNINTGNQAPIVSAGSDYSIPKLTPFTLCAQATDADSVNFTYNWEQNDLGPAGASTSPSGNAPIFRSFTATTGNCRTFPKLANILNNIQVIGELLPSYARGLNFRATVRDNELTGGAFATDDVQLTVTNDGPFAITSHNSGSFAMGTATSLNWEVANTNQAPINCALVDIYIATDGGQTFVLESGSPYPNNGTASITLPMTLTSGGRIKIMCNDNVFFDVNNANINFVPDLIFTNGFE
ncbi:hypothetical protein MNBD_GAMMA01-138 [hydrothermal vent metagenome]|uniref:Peptidase M12B domain-containing protein n=1 Tax=hydrothermal vent metagenome TaxID=652676 RepID=A0A3B0V886_9ZZZZ